MEWHFWRASGPKRVPRKIREAVSSKFRLNPEQINQLRMLDRPGSLAGATGAPKEGRQVLFIRIIDPSAIEGDRLAGLTYDDLKTGRCRQALRFEGHIEKNGVVHLADRRPPRKLLTSSGRDPEAAAPSARQ